jgi:4-amino-4-deoxy-L-arabinose transferase-like glycosyltransferase
LFSIAGIYKILEVLFNKTILSLIGAWHLVFLPASIIIPLIHYLIIWHFVVSIWGLVFFFSWFKKKKLWHLFTGGFLLAIGTLCKLPFVIYYAVPFTFFLLEFFRSSVKVKSLSNGSIFFFPIVFPALWYLNVIPQWHGNGIVSGILNNQVSVRTILDYLNHNLVSTLPELLLNYGSVIFFIAGFYFLIKNKAFKDKRFILIFVWSLAVLFYFFFEINMIGKVHDYYLFPFLPILFILVGYGAYNMLQLDKKIYTYVVYILLIILPFTCYLRMAGRWDTNNPGFNKDLLVFKEELRNAVPSESLVVAGNDESYYIFFYYIDKKGWGFSHNSLSREKLESMILKGAEYIYSDSRVIDENYEIAPLLGELILEKGSIKVYRLKSPSLIY